MFCNNCGSQIPDDAKFCNKCGAQANSIPASTVEAEPKQKVIAPSAAVAPPPTVEVVQTPVIEQAPSAQEVMEPTPVPVSEEPPVESADTATEAPAAQPGSDNRCPNCQCEITPGIKFCPECGSAIVNQPGTTANAAEAAAESAAAGVLPSAPDAPQAPVPAKRTASWKVWLGIIIALVVLVGGISKCSSESGSQSKGTNEDYISCAIQLTRENLKSPSSARFYDCVVEETDDYGRILVSLEFEAQNSFGAMIRNYAIVVLQDYDDGTFTYNPNFAVQFYKNSYEKSDTIAITKGLNNWNEPKSED